MAVRTDNLAATGMAATTFFYYAGPQMIQSVQQTPASPADGATTVTDQYVYSPRYVNAPILDTQTVSTYSASNQDRGLQPASRYYFLTDANYNVTALESSGAVIERYVYSAYGTATVYSPDYSTTYSASTVGNTVLFAGMWFDPRRASRWTSTRWDNTVIDTFVTSDPAQQGTNWYEVQRRRPRRGNRPHGSGRGEFHRAEQSLQPRTRSGQFVVFRLELGHDSATCGVVLGLSR